MGSGLLVLWNHWSIQILVLVSLGLQLFLFAIAGIRRRHGANPLLRSFLWLGYVMADSTAILALSHISLSGTKTGEHRIVSFWAPFLLLHLGGPDNLSAYALQDNQLWVRHLHYMWPLMEMELSLIFEGSWNTLGLLRNKWGMEALDRHQSKLEKQDYEHLKDRLGVEFQEGIIIWHIATDVFLAKSNQAKKEGASARVEAIKLLSNYMMFLLLIPPWNQGFY